ncbi:MAG: PQQ-dependent dehydrogenase, methanol/ethanol family [Pseudomonadales bacterium]|nr:PQQ-dependent dehydrogenase, methanol/ethanol family [Pseudomonadales bacterium]
MIMTKAVDMKNLLILLLATALLAGCGPAGEDVIATADSAGPAASARSYATVDGERIIAEADSGANWLSHGRTYNEQRYSPLTQINTDNVSQLGLAWYADFETRRGQESTPIVVDGVIYVTEAWSKVRAYDARSGELLWFYDPEVPGEWAVNACCDVVNRGVAAWEGKIFVGTIDGRLIALDAATGEEIWDVMTVPAGERYAITGAPRVAKGKVFIGQGGAEFGVRGFVAAYDVDTGNRDWIWYTVPGNPADGFENEQMRMAAETWNGEWWLTGGGGTVWDSIVYDPVTDLLIIGVGNGSPWPAEIRSPGGGDNLFLSSIVALNPDTGDYVWHYQTTPADSWDFTAVQQIIIADLDIEGQRRHVAMQQPKNGFFYVLDAATGELLSADMVVPVTWASGVDMATGRPIENPEARYDKTGKGMVVTPSFGGSHNWHPMSFNPDTGLVYIPAVHSNYGFVATQVDDNPMGQNLSISTTLGPRLYEQLDIAPINESFMLAWDPVKQREAWRVPYGPARSGGTLSTAGNLVFQGNRGDNSFAAFNATTGEKLWSQYVQTGALAGPATYLLDGEQYVAVVGGFKTTRNYYEPNYSRLLVFKRGGSAQLPPEQAVAPLSLNPPPAFGSEAVLARGEEVYETYCGACHGIDGQSRGNFPDLRYSPALNSAELFSAIVIDGVRSSNGMVSFAQAIDGDDAEAVRAYMTGRAHDAMEN